MKNTAFLTLIICALFSSSPLQAQDTNAALDKAKEAVDAFFAYDAKAFGETFATDGWMVNPYGMRTNGKAEIISGHSWLFDQWKEQRGTYTIKAENADTLPGGVVVVSLRVHGVHSHDNGEIVSDDLTMLIAVLTLEGQSWKINQLQLTPVSNPQQG